MTYKYNFVTNDYEVTKAATDELLALLGNAWELSDTPDYVFILGGDQTFLKALHQYENCATTALFIPFKLGGIGFYTNHNWIHSFDGIIANIEKGLVCEKKYEVLDIMFDGRHHLAINEAKFVNEEKAIYVNVAINGQFFQEFHGTGLVFSTATGSTGYMKATGGAVIFGDNTGMYQMNELFPVSTNKYRTLKAPLILSATDTIELSGEVTKQSIIIDTHKFNINASPVVISMGVAKVRVCTSSDSISRVDILRDLFIQDRKKYK